VSLLPEDVLDDRSELEVRDPGGMLPAVASGAAQVREATVLAGEAGLSRLAGEDLPRSVVVCGMGGSGIAGDVLAAVAGSTCPVPVLTWRGHGLPIWVGAADLVIAVSCSGTTEETLSALDEAARRGCRLLVVSAAGSPAEQLASRGRGLFVPVTQGRQPRASLWALSTPLVIAADALGLLTADHETVELTAVLLEQLAVRCQPDADTVLNPGKSLALSLVGRLPVVWGSSALSGVAAYRFACQLNGNAKVPAAHGVLPEAAHNQVVGFDGAFAGGPVTCSPTLTSRQRPGCTWCCCGTARNTGRSPGAPPRVATSLGRVAWRSASCRPRAVRPWSGWPLWWRWGTGRRPTWRWRRAPTRRRWRRSPS